MSQRKRTQQRVQAKDASLQVGEPQSKRVLLTPSLEDCTFATEWISPAPDTKKILLRRLFFINPDNTKFVSVGFHASSAYLPLAEFGGSKITSILLSQDYLNLFASHLHDLLQAMCENKPYSFISDDRAFKVLVIGKNNHLARMSLNKQFLLFKQPEIRYLLGMIHILQLQLASFSQAQQDVVKYAAKSLLSDTFELQETDAVLPLPFYFQLYQELKPAV
jgi:hypothetical protein